MRLENISIALAQQTYPIILGQGIVADSDKLAQLLHTYIHGEQVFIVTQPEIAVHYLACLHLALSTKHCSVHILPASETSKNITAWENILSALISQRFDRSCTLIALGGGVVGDVTGFAAACYLRGVAYIQMPTTLMAQVDSAIGGKTAINHVLGKNMIGAFHQPRCVISDAAVLETLPQPEFIAGLAEVIKYGLIYSADFFIWLETNIERLLSREGEILSAAIKQSVQIKASFVMADETEQGRRALLNFGHTFGHAIEAADGYKHFRHGEAVAYGMAIAAELSELLGFLTEADKSRIIKLLQRAGLLRCVELLPSVSTCMLFMQNDKKNTLGKLTVILLKSLGEAFKTAAVLPATLTQAMAKYLPE